jgi:hypothetical protein
MNLTTLLLRLYPHDWRARYGDEFQAVLEARPLTATDALDVALNALDARLNPDLVFTTTPLSERMLHLMQKLRSAEITIFAAWIAFVVAGLRFYGLMDDSVYAASGRPVPGLGVRFDPDLSNPRVLAWNVLAAGSAIALAAILVGGLPIAYAAWRRSPQVRRLFLVPVAAFVAILLPPGIAIALNRAGISHGPIGIATNLAANVSYSVLFIAAAVASTWAVARAVNRSEINDRVLRFAYLPGVVATLAMALMLGATVAWGVFAHIQHPQLFDSGDFLASSPTLASWAVIVAVMAIATAVAAVGCIRGMAARGEDDDAGAVAAA